MTPPRTRPSLASYLRDSWKVLFKEVSAFGLIGIIGLVIDLSIFAALADGGAVKAKFISTVVATTFAYFGNRYLSFSHRARTSLRRESAFFFGINGITLLFSELIIAFFVYPLGFDHGSKTVFAVNLVTIGLGTIFRFWAYKRFVFLHPDKVNQHPRGSQLDAELAE